MAVEARFVRGENVHMRNHTPGVAVAAGEVVPLTTGIGIAHRPILANALGALGVDGGEYEALAAAAYAIGTDVWWDNTANRITTTSAANSYAGKITKASTGVGTYCQFLHLPPTPVA